MKTKMGMGAAAAALLLCASAGNADVVEFKLTKEFSGSGFTPAGTLSAIFDDGGTPGSVTLTMVNDLAPGEFATVWFFMVHEDYWGSGDLQATYQSGQAATGGPVADPTRPTINPGTSSAGMRPDGDGFFDIRFNFATSGDTFVGGDTSVYIFTGDGLTAHHFNLLSRPGPGPGNPGPFPTAAHVQGIAGGGSGWVTVPLPTSAWIGLAGLGLAGGVSVIKRRR